MRRQGYRKRKKGKSEIAIPEPGTDAWENMVDFMRADLESGMMYSNIIEQGRKIVEARGENFEEAFEKWKDAKNG